MSVEPPASVLVLRFGSVGDVILTSPAIEALKSAWPQTRVYYAVKAAYVSLMKFNPFVDEVVPLERGERFLDYAAKLRALNAPVLLDLHGKIRSRLLRFMLRGSRRVVWHKRDLLDTVLVYPALKRYQPRILFSDRHHRAVEDLVGRPLGRGQLRHYLGPNDVSAASSILRDAGVDPTKPMVGMSPGANWETKRWPAERFGALAKRVADRGMQVVIVGSSDEAELARRLRDVEPRAFDLSGRLPLPELGGFIFQCAAFVANDSGPMHMARALGTPTLAFFGSTPPQFDFSGHEMITSDVACAPCSFYGRPICPLGHFACMMNLSVNAAWTSLQRLLDAGRQPFLRA